MPPDLLIPIIKYLVSTYVPQGMCEIDLDELCTSARLDMAESREGSTIRLDVRGIGNSDQFPVVDSPLGS